MMEILQIPFIFVEDGSRSHLDYVVVNMDGSKHSLPLVMVYHQLQHVDFQISMGIELDEEQGPWLDITKGQTKKYYSFH